MPGFPAEKSTSGDLKFLSVKIMSAENYKFKLWRRLLQVKRNVFLSAFLIFAMFLSGCAGIFDSTVTGDQNNPPVQENEEIVKKQENKDGEAAGRKNNELVDANKKFAWELFRTLNKEDYEREIFMSPLSVSAMLTMAYNGAGGTTREAMAEAMHYKGMPVNDLNAGYKYLISRLNSLDEKVQIEIANSIWLRQGFEISQSFMELNRDYLLSDVKRLDFNKAESANEINNWVAKKTNNLIPSVINPPIPADVMMYLINAIYFKGEWTEAFKARDTYEADFYSYDRLTDKVQMMQRTGSIALAESGDYTAVSLPYGGGKAGMIVILPNKDINEFIDEFDYKQWDALLENFKPIIKLHLEIPKFKMEYGIKELNKTLVSLGMGEIFSENADFSGIAENIFISRVLHKAVVDVNEKGTEAAAVTVGEFVTTSYSEPVKFIANRPFIFVIHDAEDGSILFIGKKLFGDRKQG